MFARLHRLSARDARRRADELLEQFGLTDAGDRQVKGYSGGMKRRLDLAVSFVTAPRVLFLDEPTTGQDPRNRMEVWSVVRELVAGGTTVLLTTHYLDEADQLADRISVVDRGRVIADGTPDALKRRLGGSRVDLVLPPDGDLVAAAAVLARVSDGEPEVDAERRRVSAPVHDRVASLTEVLRGLQEQAIAVEDVALRQPTLDDVFLQLTGSRAQERPTRDRRWPHERAATGDPRHLDARRPRHAALALRAGADRLDLAFPILSILLFGYVFGSAIVIPGGGDYREYLMPGLFVMAAAFGISESLFGIATDAERGITNRFRSMPMARAAILAGGCVAAMVNAVVSMVVMVAMGLAVGWSWHDGIANALAAVALHPAAALRRAVDRDLRRARDLVRRVGRQHLRAAVPLTMISAIFVSPAQMPDWLGTIAEWNPLSATVGAARQLFGNGDPVGDSWVAQHPIVMAVVWPLVLIAIFAPLAVRRYRGA